MQMTTELNVSCHFRGKVHMEVEPVTRLRLSGQKCRHWGILAETKQERCGEPAPSCTHSEVWVSSGRLSKGVRASGASPGKMTTHVAPSAFFIAH